ncbi:MAG TPA: hypothetical protein VKS78_04055 [Roseiarcus sp.]|nr:hypothetical protein [Roseiarcus sp.]
MANGAETSIIDAAMTACKDALAARERMPTLFWIAIAIVAALSLVFFGIAFSIGPGFLSSLVILILSIVQGFFLTPLAIAVHRFVLLGESNDSYNLDPQSPRFQKFFTFLAGIFFIEAIPQFFRELLWGPIGGVVGLVLAIVVAVIVTRNVILFPAVAVDAPGADWPNAMADTQGHSWRVFFILLCIALPLGIAGGILMAVFAFIPIIGWVIIALIRGALTVAIVASFAAAASHLYAAYANQLGRPSGLPSAAATGSRY